MSSVMFWPLFALKTLLVAVAGVFGSLQTMLESLGGALAVGPRFREPGTLVRTIVVHNRIQRVLTAVEGVPERALARLPWVAHRTRIALVTCMDARLALARALGDSRKGSVYVMRTPGGALTPSALEGLRMGVRNGVGVVLFADHDDCLAVRTTATPEGRATFPTIAGDLDDRAARYASFLADDEIRRAIEAGLLRVFRVRHLIGSQRLDFLNEFRVPADTACGDEPARDLAGAHSAGR